MLIRTNCRVPSSFRLIQNKYSNNDVISLEIQSDGSQRNAPGKLLSFIFHPKIFSFFPPYASSGSLKFQGRGYMEANEPRGFNVTGSQGKALATFNSRTLFGFALKANEKLYFYNLRQ